jgi:glutathione S-transferase
MPNGIRAEDNPVELTLYIGNKAYSSWSLRPWLLLTQFGIPFAECVTPLYQPTTPADLLRHAPTGKVPALHAGDIIIWESLAIIEFLAETYPDRAIWPQDRAARAMARALASEMHAGFVRLRQVCPTNFRRSPKSVPLDDLVLADIARIEAAWAAARHAHGSAGPFLFGAFSAADAMFAPVCNRFQAYAIEVRPETRAYMEAVMALPAWQAWIEGAAAEPWHVEQYDTI